MASHLDPQLAEKILHEVKSQGVFDEFRKDSIADVDIKPAYQNLRQRVENAVQKFLSEQRWTPETNKYQLRERLRRHIVESEFFDVGVERIVDQVVNPKIGSVFQPRIEEIAYKFLGISPPLPAKRDPPPPPPMPMPPLPPFPPLNGSPLKVETDASHNLLPTDLEQVSPDSDKMKEEDMADIGALEEKADDDDESPPFEPLTECKSPKSEPTLKKEDVSENSDMDIEPKNENDQEVENIKVECIKNEDSYVPKEKSASNDALASQESQLSQVSSDSRMSSMSNQLLQRSNNDTSAIDNTNVNISEEAQMPKFNENSTGTEGSAKDTSELHFDIKKDEIKFEGTERKTNILDGDVTEFSQAAPVIKDAYTTESLDVQGSFHFTKLNVEVEPCSTTHGAASSVSSQDDTSSAQLCIVERPENELQGETNSTQKCPQEDSNTNTTIPTTQVRQSYNSKSERNGKHYSSSSSSSSRLKKSCSKDIKHSTEKDRQNDEKYREKSKYRERDLERDRERHRDRDRHSDAKYSSKASSSSSRRHESSGRHKSSSKRSEKGQHISSSSRSESRSRHKSSKRDHHDKYDRKKSHKSSSASKEHRSESRKSHTDDHNETKKKICRRKSTDSNDEDKNPSSHTTTNNTAHQSKNVKDTESTSNVNTKSNSNGSSKHDNETKKSSTHESKSDPTKVKDNDSKINTARVVFLNDILEHPSTNFVELETISNIQVHSISQSSPASSSETVDIDLLYFEQSNSQFQTRLDLLNNAIHRCRTVLNDDTTITHEQENNISEYSDDELSSSKYSDFQADTIKEDIIKHVETKATLLVDCFHYSDCNHQNTLENMEATSPKRLKLITECNISKFSTIPTVNVYTKENQMKENNSLKTEEDNKKSTLSKRIDTMTKLSQQQRYSSEDLYKPRPVLGQRSKRRGLDTVI